MKTLNAVWDTKGYICNYRRKHYGTYPNMEDLEQRAQKAGFTHIKWFGLPVGNGKPTKCKIVTQ